MIDGDTLKIDGCQYTTGTIYDNGGPTGDYSDSFDGWVIIEANAGSHISISGTYYTESGYDFINIWDNDTLVARQLSGTNTITVSCNSGRAIIRFTSDGGSNRSGFSLHFTIAGGPSSANRINNLTANGITSTGATLQWTSGNSGPFHVLCDNPVDDNVTTSSTSYTLTGLNPSTRHTVTVYAEGMENNRCAQGTIQFRTHCGTCRLPFREDFDDVTPEEMPSCWTRSVNFDDTYSLPRVISYNNGNNVQMLSCGSNNTGGHFGMVITPTIASSAQEWHVRFRMKTSHAYTKVIVGFCDSTSDEQASYGFTAMETLSPNSNEWTYYAKTYTVPAGGCRLAFRMVQSTQSGVGRMAYIDDLIIETCGVRQARAIHSDVSSFELYWDTVGSPDVTVRVRPAWGAGTEQIIEHANSPLTVTGLSPNTRYEIVFFASCNGEQQIPTSIYANTVSMDDFEDDLCLRITPWNSVNGSYELAEGWSTICASGSASTSYEGIFRLKNNCYLITPPLNQPGGKELMLEYKSSNSASNRVVIGTMTYPDDISTFTPFDTIDTYTSNYADTAVRLPNGLTDHYLALKGLCNGSSSVDIRSLSLNAGHVKGATIKHVKNTQVTLQWNAPTTGKVYIEYYSSLEGTHYHDSVTNASQAIITGLTPEQTYFFDLYLPGTDACPHVGNLSATTTRHDYSIPYCEDFEDFLPNEAYGWSVRNSLYGCPTQSVEYIHSGEKSLKLSAASGNYTSTITLPEIEGAAGSIISFWAYTLAPASSVIVGYSLPNSTVFNALDTLAIASNVGWRHYVCSLPASITGKLALRYALTGCEGIYYVWIDDLTLGAANYSDYTFANLNCNSIDVVWHAVGTTDSLDVIMASGTDTIRVTGVPDTIHVTGLSTSRRYACYILPHGGCLVYAGSFYTMNCSDSGGGEGGGEGEGGEGGGGGGGIAPQRCNPMDDLLSYELPHGWKFSDSLLASLVSDNNGGYHLQMLSPTAPDSWSTDTLPGFSYTTLYFRARALSPGVRLAANGDTVTLDTSWQSYAFLPSYPTTISICGGTGCLLDDVGQSLYPRVKLSVEGNILTCDIQGGLNYEYILHLQDPDGNERGQHITTTPSIIDNLQPSTEYTVWWEFLYMDASCVPSFTVKTEAIPLPYCVNLEDNNNTLPAGWIATQRGGYEDVSIDGTNRIRFIAGNNNWNYLILPQMETSNYLQLSLYGSFTGQDLQVGHLALGTDTSSFVLDSLVAHNAMNIDGTYSFGFKNIGSKRIALRYRGYCLSIQRLGISRDPKLHFHIFSPNTLTIQAETDSSHLFASNSSDLWPTSIIHTVSTNPFTVTFGNNDLYIKQFGGLPDCNFPMHITKPATAPMPYCDDVDYNDLNTIYSTLPGNTYQVSFTTVNWRNCYQLMSSERPTLFIMPYLTNTSVSNTRFSFDCKANNPGSAIEVGVMTDLLDSTSFQPVDTIVCTSSNWHREFVDMSRYSGNGRWIAFRTQNTMLNGNFYFNKIRLDACFLPSTVSVHLERYTQVVIEGDADSIVNGPFWVEYGNYGITPGQGTLVYFDSLPARINLAPSSEYSVYVYCGNDRSGCSNHYYISTSDLPLYVPSCTNFESEAINYIPQGWTASNNPSVVTNASSHEGNRSLAIHGIVATPVIDVDTLGQAAVGFWLKASEPGAYLIVGSMTTPTIASSFHPLKVLVPSQIGVWEYHLVSLADAPSNAHYIAFRNASSNVNHNLFIDELLITRCAVFDMQILNFDNNSLSLFWKRLGSPDASIKVCDNTISSVTQYDLASLPENNLAIPITPQHDYQITISSSCSSEGMPCAVPYTDTINIAVPAEGFGCVDPSDLHSPQAVFFSGSYNNPYANRGAVDFGPLQAESRHSINSDTSARDPRTGNLLRTIPQGYSSSVRLGNWNSNSATPEAEGIIYSFLVDTLDFSLLLLHYAAVLQDPMHAPEDQPRFRLELLDTNFNLIDPLCTAADFIANRNLGWNEAPDNVLWKDWTTVGVDLSSYHGQQLYLRLTTYDCNEGSHFGYAYFTLECRLKNIISQNCGNADSNIFSAPAGFDYRWYTTTSSTTLSSSQTLVVPTSQSTTYLCDLSFTGNPSCHFTLSAFGGSRYPLARFDTIVSYSNCRINVQFVNHSTVSSDGINPVASNEAAETAHWDFGNGLSSDSYHGYTSYSQPGTYTVTLITGISGGECKDTLVVPITVDFPSRASISGPQSLCFGDLDTLWLIDATTSDSLWQQSSGQQFLPLSPSNYQSPATNYQLSITDSYGCSYPISHSLRINPTYTRRDSIRLCTPQLPFHYADTVFLPGTVADDYHQYGQTTFGCDSSFQLHLQVSPITDATILDTVEASICDNESYSFFGFSYTDSGEHIANHIDNLGHCDSLHSLFLDVRPTSTTDTNAIACNHFSWYGSLYSADTSVSRTGTNIYLCDSTTTLILQIHPTYDLNDSIVVCHNQRYLYEGVDYGGPIAFDSPHLSRFDCDSLVHVTLYPSNPLFPAPPIVSLDSIEWYPYDTLLLGCNPQHLFLLDTSISINRFWTLWNVDDTTEQYTSPARKFSPTLDTTGIFGFQLISVSDEGCRDTVRNDSLLWVYPSPVANFFFSPSHLSIHNPEAQFYNQTVPDTCSYLWLFPLDPGANSQDSSFAVNPFYSWEVNSDPNDYPVSLIAYWLQYGPDTLSVVCTDTATIPVAIVNTYLQFPNTVTPNGDGINDRWVIVNLLEMGEYSMNELWIYDRWGSPVYHVKNISQPSHFWDPEDTHSPDGTYYYRFLAKDNFGVVKRNGVIEVSR